MPKQGRWWVSLLPLTAALIVLLAVFFVNRTPPGGYVLRMNGHSYQLEPAITEAAQEHGLSGRAQMAADRGMLFIFPNEAAQCFWMKGMHFPLDIIWTDSGKRVTHIEHNLSPATYPHQYCAPGRYVIELGAGTAVKNHLTDGQRLDF